MERPDGSSVSRRALVGAVGVAGIGVTAGCLDGETGEEGGSTDDGSANRDTDLELVDHPGNEPIEPPEGYNCPVCNMQPAQYPNWNAQLVHENDGAAFFDSAGCLFAYYADPEKDSYGGPGSDIVAVWATDFETREMIDATDASFVLEDDQDRNDDPMDSPVPFADRDDAVAYVEEYDNLSEDDIAGLEAADSDDAEMYR